MPASRRMSASACARMPSNAAERWLISRIDMPTPGSETRSRWISSSTGIGSTAGPAEKLWTRCTVFMSAPAFVFSRSQRDSDRHEMQIENVRVARLYLLQQRVGRRAVEVDARHGGVRALEDH